MLAVLQDVLINLIAKPKAIWLHFLIEKAYFRASNTWSLSVCPSLPPSLPPLFVCIYMWRPEVDTVFCSCSPPYLFVTPCLPRPWALQLPGSILQCSDSKCVPPYLAFSLGSGGPNSSIHVCTRDTLQAQPPHKAFVLSPWTQLFLHLLYPIIMKHSLINSHILF